MAASLAVEWAKTGVRVNVLRFVVASHLIPANTHTVHKGWRLTGLSTCSPGYMLTKLTKTILERDTALKTTWENLTPMGKVRSLPLRLSLSPHAFFNDLVYVDGWTRRPIGCRCFLSQRRFALHDRLWNPGWWWLLFHLDSFSVFRLFLIHREGLG